MENKSAQKSRFNFIDVIIILLVAAVVAAAIYVITRGTSAPSGTKSNVTYTLVIKGVNESHLSLISEGDVINNSSTGNAIGKVTEVTSKHSVYIGDKIVIDGSGHETVSVSEYDNLYDVYVTLQTEASVDDRGIAYVDGNKILVGAGYYIRKDALAKTAYCTAFAIG